MDLNLSPNQDFSHEFKKCSQSSDSKICACPDLATHLLQIPYTNYIQ